MENGLFCEMFNSSMFDSVTCFLLGFVFVLWDLVTLCQVSWFLSIHCCDVEVD